MGREICALYMRRCENYPSSYEYFVFFICFGGLTYFGCKVRIYASIFGKGQNFGWRKIEGKVREEEPIFVGDVSWRGRCNLCAQRGRTYKKVLPFAFFPPTRKLPNLFFCYPPKKNSSSWRLWKLPRNPGYKIKGSKPTDEKFSPKFFFISAKRGPSLICHAWQQLA